MADDTLAAGLLKAEQIDAICDKFERDWDDARRRIEDLLAEASATPSVELFRALLGVEVELRLRAGEKLASKEYEQRFPQWKEPIREVFREAKETLARRNQSATSLERTASLAAPAQDTSLAPPARRNTSTDTQKTLTALGRFEILHVLGSGAFGTVYKARDPNLDRTVAIKVPLDGVLKTEQERERFLREARAAAKLNHPNICPVHEVGKADGQDFIVMSYIEGRPLSQFIPSGKIQPRQAAVCVRKLALALQEAHKRGIVHRDIKPANIMINRNGEPVVMDFGLARVQQPGDVQLTQQGQIIGSPSYMSPEQARGVLDQIGPATDIYSLGVVLYELLCGQRPFTGNVLEVIGKIQHLPPTPLSTLQPDVDPQLEAICMKAMAKSPQDRYASMTEFAQALTDYIRGQATAATRSEAGSDTVNDPEANGDDQLTELFAAMAAEQRSLTRQAIQEAAREGARSARSSWIQMTAVLSAVVLVLFSGLWFFVRKDTVTVVVNIPLENIRDPALTFFLDGKERTADDFSVPIELKPGKHELVVNKDGKLFKQFVFNVGTADHQPIVVQDVTPQPAVVQKTVPPIEFVPEIALEFDGDNDAVILPMTDVPETCTVEAWVRAERTSSGYQIVVRADFPTTRSLFFIPESGSDSLAPRFGGATSQQWFTADPKESLPQIAEHWVHLAGVWSQDSPTVFINGKRMNDAHTVYPYRTQKTSSRWYIGAQSVDPSGKVTYSFKGSIHKLRISDSARYNSDFTPERHWEPDAHTIALYAFDEGQGTELLDSSGHGHHGSIIGAKWIRPGQ